MYIFHCARSHPMTYLHKPVSNEFTNDLVLLVSVHSLPISQSFHQLVTLLCLNNFAKVNKVSVKLVPKLLDEQCSFMACQLTIGSVLLFFIL